MDRCIHLVLLAHMDRQDGENQVGQIVLRTDAAPQHFAAYIKNGYTVIFNDDAEYLFSGTQCALLSLLGSPRSSRYTARGSPIY